jgi:hypothetical protein
MTSVTRTVLRRYAQAATDFAASTIFRSRCTTPAPWIAVNAPVAPSARAYKLAPAQRAVSAYDLVQSEAIHELRDQEWPLGADVGVEHLSCAKWGHLPGTLDLLPEPATELRLGGVLRPYTFDSHPFASNAFRQIDSAHPAGAEASQQPVTAEAGGIGG